MPKIYQPGQRIDHYEIIRLVARGVASHVYLAQDRQVLQQVILKFPLDDVIGGAAVFERYKREAALGKRLRHPGIQRHLNHAEQRSEEYMVLEYLPGRTLREVLEEYELCCGRTPFEEKDGFALVTRHISHDPPGILAFNPTLSPALATVIMRSIRRDPVRRYISMQDLVYDLSHLDEVTPETYIPTPPRIGGRYRQAISIALIILCVCTAIIAFGMLAQYAHSLAH